MSTNNGSTYERLSHLYNANVSSTPILTPDNCKRTNVESNLVIPTKEPVNYLPSTKRPFSSIKQLDLAQCDQELGSKTSSNAKRFKPNHNEYGSKSNLFNLFDSPYRQSRSTLDPCSLQRPSSQLSISTASSASSTPALFRNSKYLFSTQKFLSPNGLFDRKESQDRSSLNSFNRSTNESNFYVGKTTFGGSNLPKSIRRLSATPYSLASVRRFEAKPVSKQNSSVFGLSDNSRLSSVTQRIFEKLEKASTPIQDAKRRFSSYSYQLSPIERASSVSGSTHVSKLFESSFPNLQNNGRCNVDNSHKPLKYILTPVSENSNDTTDRKIEKIDKFDEKLNEIKRAELNLQEKEKLKTYSELNNKLNLPSQDPDETEESHLNALANAKPLKVPVNTLKPFSLTLTSSSNECPLTTTITAVSDQSKQSTTNDNSKSNLSLFDQFKQKKQSTTWCCPTCCVDNESTVDKCVACEEPNPNKKSSATSNNSTVNQFKFGFSASTTTTTSTIDTTTKPNNTQPTLTELFKKKSNTWTCSVCCVDNDSDETKCISCEEPNPNKKGQQAEKQPLTFKFGDLATKKVDTLQNQSETPNLTKLGANKSGEGWNCFYCKMNNDCALQKCGQCQRIKTLAATKDQVHKFYDSQSYTFSFSEPIPVADQTSEESDSFPKAVIEFSTPAIAESESDSEDTSSSVVNSEKKETTPISNTASSQASSQFKLVVPSALGNSGQLGFDVKKTESSPQTSSNKNETTVNVNATDKQDKPKSVNSLFQFGTTQAPVTDKVFNLASKSDTNNSLSLPTTTVESSSSSLSSSSLTAPISTSTTSVPLSSLFTFGSKEPAVSSGLTFTTDKSKSSSLSSSASTFVFTTSSTTTTTESNQPIQSTATFSVPKIVFGNVDAVSKTPVSVGAVTTTAAASSSTSTSISSTGGMFMFGATKTNASVTGDNNNKLFSFGSSSAVSTSSLSTPVTTAVTSIAPSLFRFGTSTTNSTTTSSESSGGFVTGTTISMATSTTSSTPTFSFNPVSTSIATATTNSLFNFGASTTTPVTTTSASSTLPDTKFTFGSPVTFPRVDIGSPLQNSKISLNVTQPNVTVANNAPSVFNFGASSAATNSTGASNVTESNPLKFNFQASNSVAASSTGGSTLFGQSNNLAPSFNFGSTNTANTGNNSLFNFGAKTSEVTSAAAAAAAPSPFSIQQPSVTNQTNTGFNFGSAMQPNVQFGSLFSAGSTSQPLVPSFGSSAFPNTVGTNAGTVQSSSTGFKFNPEPNLNFQSFSMVPPDNGANSGNPFQFSADQSQPSNIAANRQIRKAKRRLRERS